MMQRVDVWAGENVLSNGWPQAAVKRPEVQSARWAGDAFLLPEGQRALCGVVGCTRQQRMWKRTARPVFDGRWACGRECLRALVMESVTRQQRMRSGDAAMAEHRHRVPLGLVLVDRGVITAVQLRLALEAQRSAGFERIGYWLEKVCGVSEETMTRGLAAQWNRPVLPAAGFDAGLMPLVMPDRLRQELRALPLRVAGGKILYLGFEQDVNAAAARAVEAMCGLRVESGLVATQDAVRLDAALSVATGVPCREDSVADIQALCAVVTQELAKQHPVASRLVQVGKTWWLRLWLERAARGPHGMLPATGEDVRDLLLRL